jgi:hypothetical protein
MGLLDDAIRQHLELKRKHGAQEEELRRQESEALGPARRDFSADAAGTEGPAAAEAGTAVKEPVPEPAGWLDDAPGEAPFEPAAPPPPPEPVERVAEPPEPVSEAPEPVAEAPAPPVAQEPLPASDPAPAAEAEAAPPRRESDTPTQGFDALSADDEPGSEGEEDVLEETPDFLQDTPEHDRLWFEQKPPRDFDFDD